MSHGLKASPPPPGVAALLASIISLPVHTSGVLRRYTTTHFTPQQHPPMHLITPQAELWPLTSDPSLLVQRAAILCYGRTESTRTPEATCASLSAAGHTSMFRHATYYYIWQQTNPVIPNQVPAKVFNQLRNSEYCGMYYDGDHLLDGEPNPNANKKKNISGLYFLVLNGQYLLEHSNRETNNTTLSDILAPHQVTPEEFARQASICGGQALGLMRFTVCVTTQISTTRELNRKSPNSIAEQSTRYVNFGKRDGGITICLPHWYQQASWRRKAFSRLAWRIAEFFYTNALPLPPEDARGFLPLDCATRAVYTYSIFEWRHILRLRLLGTTGRPHPNAVIAARLISAELTKGINLSIHPFDPLFSLLPTDK